MNKSESIKSIASALNKSQSEMDNAHKKSDNPYFQSKYANLSEVLTCVKSTWSTNGLSFMQMPSFENGIVSVETFVMHISGEWITSISGAPISKSNPQGVGDAITYLRRYSLAAIAGLAQEDDDGNSNSNQPSKKQDKSKSSTKQTNQTTSKNDDNKPWYTDELYGEHLKLITEKIRNGATPYQVVTEIRLNFKVANKYSDLIDKI